MPTAQFVRRPVRPRAHPGRAGGSRPARGHGRRGSEVLLARDTEGRAAGLVFVLRQHPRDGQHWIGLLIVHGGGWQEIDRRPDAQHGRGCIVMHKRLT